MHENLPKVFPKNPSEFHVVRDIVGIRPQRDVGARLEKEAINGQNVVHAYGNQPLVKRLTTRSLLLTSTAGPPGGGYTYSFGLARAVVELVNEFDFEMPKSSL